jgi:hypothetical protein
MLLVGILRPAQLVRVLDGESSFTEVPRVSKWEERAARFIVACPSLFHLQLGGGPYIPIILKLSMHFDSDSAYLSCAKIQSVLTQPSFPSCIRDAARR